MGASDQDILPPPNIRWLIALVGEAAALRLVETHSGTRVYVPKVITADSELVLTTELPPETLRPLAQQHGGEKLNLPLCREWRIRIYRQRDGLTYSQIAKRLRITEWAVCKVLNNSGMTKQIELPF